MISTSPDSTLLALSVLEDTEPLTTWLATAAALNLTVASSTKFYSLNTYLRKLGPAMKILARLYSVAPTERFLDWARALLSLPEEEGWIELLPVSSVYGGPMIKNAWAQDPATGRLFVRLLHGMTLYSEDEPDPRDEFKLIPLLQDIDPAMSFLFALDVSAGPLLEHTTRFLSKAWEPFEIMYGVNSKPLRNLFFAERVEGAPLTRRELALREVVRLLNPEDLQGALDASLSYEYVRTCGSLWCYESAPHLELSWELIELALLENPRLLIRMPPATESMLENYLRLSDATQGTPGPLAGRIKLQESRQQPFMLATIYSLYREPAIRSSRCCGIDSDSLKIADWYGIEHAAFNSVFVATWPDPEDVFRRLLSRGD